MIAMLVCNQYSVQIFKILANRRQPFADLAPAQPGVDQQPRPFGCDKGAVARAAARQYANLYDSLPPSVPPPIASKPYSFLPPSQTIF